MYYVHPVVPACGAELEHVILFNRCHVSPIVRWIIVRATTAALFLPTIIAIPLESSFLARAVRESMAGCVICQSP